MYVDPIKRQTFNYVNQIPCENSPQNVILLGLFTDHYYDLTPQLIVKNPLFFEPTHIKTANSPNTCSAQDAGLFPKKNSNTFWNRVLFTKRSDNTFPL